MSNTYKSFEGLSGDRTFSVVKTGNGVLATIKPEGRPLGATIAVADCPAIALAFLVASGVTPRRTDTYAVGEPDNLAHIAADLQHHIEVRDKQAKDAADREALEGEALDLLNVFRAASGLVRVDSFEGYDHARPQWIAVAQSVRNARELHGGTK